MGGAATVQTCPGRDFFPLLPRHKTRDTQGERVGGGLGAWTEHLHHFESKLNQ